ncbi:hypothetical protein [Mesorhizobium temperatum]|uniref:Uncharacterized protein n=1 Tax=Mesorhizobium temperatum TaxID=241416 RepID=A0A271LLA5_9HYPH|nr:hypothetical protein [Mesorhizobium temperatum]PAQ08136.1 hypothetical protein CIT26_19440 [Mesorhizobium temperatum]
MSARQIFANGERWGDVTARAAFPVLLRRAMDGEPITYGGLDDILVARGQPGAIAIAYRYAAGKVGDICEALSDDLGERIPLLNAIIVNQGTNLPSDGVDEYLARSLGKTPRAIKRLSSEHRDAYAQQAIEAVFAFDGWDRVRRHLRIPFSDLEKGNPHRGKPIPPPDPKRFATGPESAAHKALKAWAAEHPTFFWSFGKFNKAKTEKILSSGDRLDVLFDNGMNMLAVEVKARSAPAEEIQRGVYQCIKYRAILRAMQLAAAKAPNGNAVLLLERKPLQSVIALAERLAVSIVTAPADLR